MAKKTHRLTVRLSPESYSALKDVSEAGGTTISAFLDQIVLEAVPGIRQVTKALRQAQAQNLEALDTLTEAIHAAMHESSQTAMELDKQKRLRRSHTAKS